MGQERKNTPERKFTESLWMTDLRVNASIQSMFRSRSHGLLPRVFHTAAHEISGWDGDDGCNGRRDPTWPWERPRQRRGQREPVVKDVVGGSDEHEYGGDKTIGCTPLVSGTAYAFFESGRPDALDVEDREEAGRNDKNGEVDPCNHWYSFTFTYRRC